MARKVEGLSRLCSEASARRAAYARKLWRAREGRSVEACAMIGWCSTLRSDWVQPNPAESKPIKVNQSCWRAICRVNSGHRGANLQGLVPHIAAVRLDQAKSGLRQAGIKSELIRAHTSKYDPSPFFFEKMSLQLRKGDDGRGPARSNCPGLRKRIGRANLLWLVPVCRHAGPLQRGALQA